MEPKMRLRLEALCTKIECGQETKPTPEANGIVTGKQWRLAEQ